jgi:hypothetical protein
LRSILAEIPGSAAKDWHLEIYHLVDGQERLAEVIDIKTGEEVVKTKPPESKVSPDRIDENEKIIKSNK